MGYLFLSISLLAGATKGYCGKKMGGFAANVQSAALLNLVRMILCTGLGMLVVFAYKHTSYLTLNTTVIAISAISGISTSVFVVTWLLSVRKSAYMMLDIFLMFGVLIPLAASNVFFNEVIKPTQWLGIAVLLAAVVIMCSYNNSIKEKITLSSFALLIICGIASGIADFSQKVFTKCIPDGSAAVFNFYTYLFAAFILIIFYAVSCKTKLSNGNSDIKKIFRYILIMALCLFANSYFKTLASKHLSAVLLYPLNQGCALILSAIMASVLFKEKITPTAVIGILTAFIGLLIINLL